MTLSGTARLGRPFQLLWLGQSASLIGDQVTLIALPLVAVGYAGASTFEVGVLNTLLKLPFLVIGLQAGVWVTHAGLGRAMVCADLVRGALLVSITVVLFATGALPLVLLGMLVLVLGTATVFFQVSYQSFVPEIVESEDNWHGANIRVSLSESVSLLAGPAIGGLVISAFSVAGALLLDTATYGLSVLTLALLLVGIRRRRDDPCVAPDRQHRSSMISSVRAGLVYVRNRPVLDGIMWTGAWYNLGSAMFDSMLVLFGVRTLHLSAGQVGLAVGMGAAGYPLGGLVSGRLNRRFGRGEVLWLAAFPSVIGIAVAGSAAGPSAVSMALLALGVFVVGVGQGAFAVNAVTLRQVHSEPDMRARATSVHRFTSWGMLPVGSLLAGVIGETAGLRAVMLIAAVLAGLCFVPLSARALRTAP